MPAKLTNKEFIKKARKVHGNRFKYVKDTYIQSDIPIKVICRNHGLFQQIAGDHLRGFGCSECSQKKRLTTKQFIEKAQKIHFNKYDYSQSIYVSMNTPIKIVCPKHGEFIIKPNFHIYGTANGCAKCCYSKGELFVTNWLIKHKFEFESQKKFDGCINPKTNFRLRFDFYLPKYNMCIEVDGVQHTTEKHYLNKIVVNFTGTKERDSIKTKFCKKAKIKLYRIQWIKNTEDLEKQLNKIFYDKRH